jgi:endonuclease/exonuclease/phosphatase (EEP) superfamily protein YafD
MLHGRRTVVHVGLSLLANGCARAVVPRPRATGPQGPGLRLLTYNVNFGLAGDGETLAAVKDAHADLALLQETNADWERALRAELAGAYPEMHFQHRGGAGGLALLSRLPVLASEIIPPTGDGWFPAWRVVVDSVLGKLQALNVHLRPPVSDGGSFVSGYFSTRAVRVHEIEALYARLRPGLPTLIAGDFNEEPDGRVTAYLAGKGMVSALQRHAPEEPTWRWDTSVGTLRRQLDHIVHDDRLEVVSLEVRTAGRSDHLPVVAVLRATAPAARSP